MSPRSRGPVDDDLEDDEEATSLDLKASIARPSKPTTVRASSKLLLSSSADESVPSGAPVELPRARPVRPLVTSSPSSFSIPSDIAEDDEEEATEFLPRKPMAATSRPESTARAREAPRSSPGGRAVPLGERPLLAPRMVDREPVSHEAPPRRTFERPPPDDARKSALPQRTPRPLPTRAAPPPDEHSTSLPRITRIALDEPTATKPMALDDPSTRTTTAPPTMPLAMPPQPPPAVVPRMARPATGRHAAPRVVDEEAPSPVRRSRVPTQARARVELPPAVTESSSEGHAIGTLIVEAPADAVVFVNGVERGNGTVRVDDVDRYAKHAVRVHCPGFAPWSGSVSLDGKSTARVRPSLKPRAR